MGRLNQNSAGKSRKCSFRVPIPGTQINTQKGGMKLKERRQIACTDMGAHLKTVIGTQNFRAAVIPGISKPVIVFKYFQLWNGGFGRKSEE